MKKKKLFLMAAMLLMSVCMFAQINTPQKADVNGDGDVDVADMVGVMDIMKNLGHPDGEYKYYLGVVTEEQLTNQGYVNSLIQNSTTTYKGKPSVINFPVAMSNDQWCVWIFDSKMGQPDVTDANGFKWGTDDLKELGISNPKGYTVWWSSAYTFENTQDVRWLTPHSTSYWDAGFEYSEGDLDNNGAVNEEDLNIVKEDMKVASTLEGVKYGWFFLTEDKADELYGNNRLSEWVEEQMSHLNGVYTCRPSKLHVPETGEKGYYFWIYPTSLGIVKKITDRHGSGFGFTASDLSITPPKGYGVFALGSGPSSYFKIVWE